jgi:HD-GYP domain-containing protein (c-di-GMP phosphodiesterase class II)
MTSDRTYRKALSEEVVLGEICRNAGIQFDPEIARIFVEKVLDKEWKQ